MSRLRVLMLVVGVSIVVGVACGGTPPVLLRDAGVGNAIAGLVLKGPVSGGRVVAYRVDTTTFERGQELGRATTDETGAFSMSVATVAAPIVLVAQSGTYTEEAVGLGVKLDGSELVALLPNWRPGDRLEGVRLTPVSTFAAALAVYHARAGAPLGEAHAEAMTHLNAHFGGLDWAAVTPADLTVAGVTNLSPEARAGLVLAGLSWASRLHAEAAELQPGLVVNGATLTAALAKDAADGTFDGLADGQPVKQAATQLSGLTLRQELVRGIAAFVASSRNASALRMSDIGALLAAIGTSSDPYLFCPGQAPSPTCGTAPVDTEAPVLTITRPRDGAGVAGAVQVAVQASDNVRLARLAFVGPEALVATAATWAEDRRTGQLEATLDVSALPDGPVAIRVEAADEAGNPVAKSVTVTVSNRGPRITLSAPSQGAVLKGSVTITATAQAQAPLASISRLELVAPPPGVGVDTLPAADGLSATWNTALAPEGPTTLTVRATDSYGTATDESVTVTVDNVPFGVVGAAVSAGAPVAGVTVELLAIDDETGLPVVGRPGGPVLGVSSGVTDADGGVSFALVQENYEGPVQLVARGASATYVDPSDEAEAASRATIALPSTLALSTYVARYRTGARLEVPITLWTTLADTAALAYARGRNPAQPSTVPLTSALGVVEPLLSSHITSRYWALRTVRPVSLTTSSQALRDVVYAAIPDVALNRLARDIALEVGLTPATGFGAPALVELLQRDLADGLYDGLSLGTPLVTAGTAPYALDANTTRLRLAVAMDRFVRAPTNRTGLSPVDFRTSGVYDTIAGDTSILYPSSQPPLDFDSVPPTVTWAPSFANGGQTGLTPHGQHGVVAGVLTIQADAADSSGVASVEVTMGGARVPPGIGSTASRFMAVVDTTAMADGPVVLVARACDALANCGTTERAIALDNTAPTLVAPKPVAGAYSGAIDVDATAVDASGMASLVVRGLAGFADTDAAPGRLLGAWVPTGADGPLDVSVVGCDAVANCRTQGVSGLVLDTTPPSVAWREAPPARTSQTSLAVALTATDVGSTVTAVYVRAGSTTVTAARSGGAWTATVPLATTGATTITAWAADSAVPTANSGQGRGADFEAVATIVYDGAPPTVAWAPLFTNGALAGASPVGASRIIAGALTIQADAADSSGVASVAVTLNGANVPPGVGSSASRFVAQYDSHAVADGPLTLVATACDSLGTCGVSTLVLAVDNTQPAVTIAKPAAGAFVSGGFDIDATATDASPLASFGLEAAPDATGLVDADSALSRIVVARSAWGIAAARADGAFAAPMRACDGVGNCRTVSASVVLDRTPPSVSNVASATGAYVTNATVFRLTATVADARSGVAQAWARTTLGTTVADKAGSCVGSLCTFDVALAEGVNTVTIWGVDSAGATPNGSPTGAGAQSVAVTCDTTPPLFEARADGRYYSERGITVATSSGLPVMPVQYQYGPPVKLQDTGAVVSLRKMRSKGGAGDDNVPYLTYSFARGASAAANLTPTWTLRYADGSTPAGVATSGVMRVSSHSYEQYDTYDLPITPGVSGTLVYTLTAGDAAGNSTQHAVTVDYRYVAGPVVILKAATWTPSLAAYATYFGATTRIQKWTLYNPNAEPVHVTTSLPAWATPQWTETWSRGSASASKDAYVHSRTYDGQTYDTAPWWFADEELPTTAAAGHSKWECGTQKSVDAPCTNATACTFMAARCYGILRGYPCAVGSGALPYHPLGQSNPDAYWSCPTAAPADTTVETSYSPAPGLVAYANAAPQGGESTPAATATAHSKAGWLLPAAPAANMASATALYATITLPSRAVVPPGTQFSGLATDLHPIPPAGNLVFRYHAAMYMRPSWRYFAAGHCTTWACLAEVRKCTNCGRDVIGIGEVKLYYNTAYEMMWLDDALSRLVISHGMGAVVTTAPCLASGDCSAPSESGLNEQASTIGYTVATDLYPSIPAGIGAGPY